MFFKRQKILVKHPAMNYYSFRWIRKFDYQKVLSVLLTALLVFQLIGGIFLFGPPYQEAQANGSNWYNSNWLYRKPITIDNSNNVNDLTNYQIQVSLSSSNFDFTKAQTNGEDLRFTNSDGTTLIDYWIESYDNSGQTATIWVEVPSIPASSSKTIYMYYGNSDVSSASNGDNIFEFFDGFEQDTVGQDPSRWTISQGTNSLIKVSIEQAASGIKSAEASSVDSSQATGYKTLSFDNEFIIEHSSLAAQTNSVLTLLYLRDGDTDRISVAFWDDALIKYNDGGTWISTGQTYKANTWYRFRYVVHLSSGTFDLYLPDFNYSQTGINFRNAGTSADRLYMATGVTAQGSNYWDNIRIRKYTSPEPTTSLGSEEIILPTATTPSSITQYTDGSGYLSFQTTIDDPQDDVCQLKIEYSDDGGINWYDPYLYSVSGSGSPTLNNANEYQIANISTSGGANTLTVVWDTKSLSNGNGSLDNTDQSDILIRVTPYDGADIGGAQTSSSFRVDNFGPVLRSVYLKTDVGSNNQAIDVGDVLAFVFSEPMEISTFTNSTPGDLDGVLVTSDDGTFSTTSVPSLSWSVGNTILDVTLQAVQIDSFGETVNPASSITDSFGNSDITNSPPQINNCGVLIDIPNKDHLKKYFPCTTGQNTFDLPTGKKLFAIYSSDGNFLDYDDYSIGQNSSQGWFTVSTLQEYYIQFEDILPVKVYQSGNLIHHENGLYRAVHDLTKGGIIVDLFKGGSSNDLLSGTYNGGLLYKLTTGGFYEQEDDSSTTFEILEENPMKIRFRINNIDIGTLFDSNITYTIYAGSPNIDHDFYSEATVTENNLALYSWEIAYGSSDADFTDVNTIAFGGNTAINFVDRWDETSCTDYPDTSDIAYTLTTGDAVGYWITPTNLTKNYTAIYHTSNNEGGALLYPDTSQYDYFFGLDSGSNDRTAHHGMRFRGDVVFCQNPGPYTINLGDTFQTDMVLRIMQTGNYAEAEDAAQILINPNTISAWTTTNGQIAEFTVTENASKNQTNVVIEKTLPSRWGCDMTVDSNYYPLGDKSYWVEDVTINGSHVPFTCSGSNSIVLIDPSLTANETHTIRIKGVIRAPTIDTPTALSSTSIRWNFTDNADNETGFKLYDNADTIVTSSATANLSYLDETGLSENTQYSGRYVKAYNNYGNSVPSSVAPPIYTLVDPPTNLRATAVSTNSITLSVDSLF